MPSDIANEHDNYVQRYLETKQARIIGIGREVVAMKKDGSLFPIFLSVTDQQLGGRNLALIPLTRFHWNNDAIVTDGKRLFTGVIRDVDEIYERNKTVLQQQREVLDGLLVPGTQSHHRYTCTCRRCTQLYQLWLTLSNITLVVIVIGVIIDQTGKIHAFNDSAQQLLGFKLIEVVSRNVSMLMPPEYARSHNDYIR